MITKAYEAVLAKAGAQSIRWISLVNEDGEEISTRLPVKMIAEGSQIHPSDDLIFAIAAGSVVAGWAGFDREEGGTKYCAIALPLEVFNGRGEYTLLADGTGISHAEG